MDFKKELLENEVNYNSQEIQTKIEPKAEIPFFEETKKNLNENLPSTSFYNIKSDLEINENKTEILSNCSNVIKNNKPTKKPRKSSTKNAPLNNLKRIRDLEDDDEYGPALRRLKNTVLSLTFKIEEQMRNQKKFLEEQHSFQTEFLSVQQQIYEERKRENDLLQEHLKSKKKN